VSFFEVSAILEVSFLEVSVAVVSPPAVPLPLQAAKETAIANAKTLSLNEFFMLIFLK
jgi:hypothetical protein